MVPVAEWALEQDFEFFRKIKPLDFDIRGDVLLLFAVAAVTIVYFNTFDAPLRRTMADGEEGEGSESLTIDVEGVGVPGADLASEEVELVER